MFENKEMECQTKSIELRGDETLCFNLPEKLLRWSNKICNVCINVTLRRVHKTIIVAEKKCALHILSICLQPQVIWHASYCLLWPMWLHHISPYYLINRTNFGIKLLNIKFVFRFFLQLLPETFLVLRRTVRDMIKNVYSLSCKEPAILARF